jgi:hypothetical protein
MTEVIKSGMEVPAARKVRPMTWRQGLTGLDREDKLD